MLLEWTVLLHTAFEPEFAGLPDIVQDELLAHARLLEMFGPQLGRPRVDALNGSRHANMKEFRFDANDGVWRVAFAFDPERRAILLIAGDKAGTSEKRFYRQLINKADERFDAHLHQLEERNPRPIMKNLQDIMSSLPPDRRTQVEARAEALIAEEMTLRDLRKAHDLTQKRMAELLGVGQESISRLEGRADMLLSTLRSYITAMGGSLDLVVRFPDRPSVSLSALFAAQNGDKETTRRTQ